MFLSVRRCLATLLFFVICMVCHADYIVMFSPVDSITRLDLRKCEALVFLPGDTMLVSEGHFMRLSSVGDIRTQQMMTVYLPKKETEYHIMIDAEGYNTRLLPVKLDKTVQEGQLNRLGEIGLMRMPKMLGEVTVEATKIKMYYKGDTLIYNADAFILPDGSMLDDLIRKLDGVHINANGEIFCNGRKVRSLQLQGRQLFDGDPKTLLQNLGAYTVSKIKVYDYVSDKEKFLGYDENESGKERELVMDVNLKKEYSIGKWVNVDAGYGSSDRYLGRGFMLGFTPSWAVTAFVNANNLDTGDDPDQYSSWRMGKGGSDEASYLNGGLSYQNDWKQGERNRKIKGSVKVASSRQTDRTRSERINYLPTGDTYESHYSNGRNRNFSVSTNHSMDMRPSRKVFFNISPSFNYSNNHNEGQGYSATFNEYLGRVTAEEIEAIYSRDPEQMSRHVINRNLSQSMRESKNIGGRLSTSVTLRLPDINDGSLKQNITLNGSGNYGRQTSPGFRLSTINYGDNPVPASQYYDYTRQHPSNNYGVNGSANYALNSSHGAMSLRYAYEHIGSRSTYARYMLNELSRQELDGLPFGQLPTGEDELEHVLDLQNTNSSKSRHNNHNVYLNISANFGERDFDKGGHGAIYFAVNPSLRIMNSNMHYVRHDYDTIASQTSVLPGVSAYLNLFGDYGQKKQTNALTFNWSSSGVPLDVARRINVSNTTDPLYITQGNTDLRNAYNHRGTAAYQFRTTKWKWQTYKITYEYGFTTNAIVNGVNYNPVTGVRISRPYNVDGNRYNQIDISCNAQILRYQEGWFNTMTLDLNCRLNNRRSVDMVSESTTETGNNDIIEPKGSYVYRKSVNPSASLSFKFKNFDFTLGATGSWNRYTGEASYYNAFTSANTTYRVTGNIRLPKNISLNSSFNVYTRSGYNDPNLNSTECIWNASASWYWKKAKLTFSADAYDLLHQIKRVSYFADAMGRTESWSNTIPRYAMMRVRYHFDISPK